MSRRDRADGLPALPGDVSEATRLLSLDRAALRGMTAEEVGEAEAILTCWGFHLQRLSNREEARAAFLLDEVNRTVAPLFPQVKGYGLEERRLLALQKSEDGSALDRLRRVHEGRAKHLAYLAQRVDAVARSYRALQETKRKQHG